LIERTPRSVRLSAQARCSSTAPAVSWPRMSALSPVCLRRRRFALGIAAHVAGPEVTTLLARLNAHDPGLTIEVRLDNSRNLLDAFDRGELDAAIVRREDDRRDGEVLGPSISAGSQHRRLRAPAGRAALRLAALTPPPAACATSPPMRSTRPAFPGRRCFSVAALQW
jgi:DNA-binding transcriptional LysR family regulator